MKRLKVLLSMLLVIAVVASLMTFTSAENTEDEEWQADLLQLLGEEDVPQTTVIQYDLDIPEGAATEEKTYSQELVSSNGDVLNVEFKFLLNGIALADAEWDSVTEWLKNLVINSVQTVQARLRIPG